MWGIIERIKFYPVKGSMGMEMTEGTLIEGLGLEGDWHAKGGDRQVSLLFSEKSSKITDKEAKGLCYSRFKENIKIFGLTPDEARAGTRLEAGDAVLEITGETKRCHEECVFFKAGKRCSLAGLNLFAKVVKGGVIRSGDKVSIA